MIFRRALLCLAVVALTLAAFDGADAQKVFSRAAAPAAAGRPSGGGGIDRGGGDGGFRGGGWGAAIPGVLMAIPQAVPPQNGPYIDDTPRGPGQPRNSARRGPSGAPPANERRMVPDEVVVELPNTFSRQALDALQRRSRLTLLERQTSQLAGTTLYRWRITDRRSVPTMIRQLETDSVVVSAQPNYLFALQQTETKTEGDPAQYELAKLHLPQAHALAKGDNVLVAVIDSGVDASHPDLAGAVAQSFNAIESAAAPHKHGTSIAGLIAAHGRLMGAAPGARLLAIRAFDPAGATAEGSTFNILKSLDLAAANGARVVNMSFAGPADPAIHRSLEAARRKNIVLVAAAGNAGRNRRRFIRLPTRT